MFEYAFILIKNLLSFLFARRILAIGHQLPQVLPQVLAVTIPVDWIYFLFNFPVDNTVKGQLKHVVYHPRDQLSE